MPTNPFTETRPCSIEQVAEQYLWVHASPAPAYYSIAQWAAAFSVDYAPLFDAILALTLAPLMADAQ